MTIRPWRPVRHIALVVLALTAVVSPDLLGQGRRARASVMVDGREAVDGEVLVRFRNAAAAFERARAEEEVEADEVEPVGRRGTRRMRARRLGTREMMARLRANPDVEFVEPNYIIRLAATPNDPSFGNLWGLFNFGQTYGGVGIAGADIDATQAWDMSTGTRANVVGVVDTGIDYNHPDLAANIWTAPSAFSVTVSGVVINCAAGTHGFNAINNTCNPMDDHNHGTHVAGTIGAVGHNGVGVAGVNWTASMMGLKFLAANGSGTTSNAIRAIEFAVQAKLVLGSAANVRILSNSWGGGGYSQSLLDEINRANTFDMLFVAAAGNSGMNADVSPMYPAAYSAPNILSVAATDNRDQRASFSNYGAASVHLGAPGVSILSTIRNNGYASFNGTSMATPHVSGAAALLLSTCTLGTAALKSAILNAVDPIPSMAGITTTGGRLNVNNAIRVCPPIANPVPSLASISPATLYAGSAGQTLTVTGSGFVTNSEARFDGAARATTVTNNSTLTITLSLGDLAGVGSHDITVVNPTPGGGTSNSLTLNVLAPPTLTPAATTVAPGGTLAFTVSNGPGNATDWVSLFCPATAGDGQYGDWKYLNNTRTLPVTGLTSATVVLTAPAAANTTCNARFFDNFTKLATSTAITIVSVAPAAPTLSVSPATVVPGGTITVTIANGPANRGDWVALFPSSGTDASYVDWMYLNGQRMAPSGGLANATLQFIAPAAAGTYNVRLFANDSWTKIATSAIITVASSTPAITVTPSVGPGGTITVTIANGPANRGDWVALFPSGGTDASYLDWMYLNGQRMPPATGMANATLQFTAPAAAGTYNVRLFANDSWAKIATSASITVASSTPTITVTPSVSPGGTITVTIANAPANRADWIGLFPSSGADASYVYVDWSYLNGQRMPPATGMANATLQFTAPAMPGTYNVRLFANDSWTKIATSAIITVASSTPTITVTPSVSPGGTITVTIANGPANQGDWIALFPSSGADASYVYVEWSYLNGQRMPPATGMANATLQFTAPALPGVYNVRLFANDSWAKIATSATITVQ